MAAQQFFPFFGVFLGSFLDCVSCRQSAGLVEVGGFTTCIQWYTLCARIPSDSADLVESF